MSPRKQVKRRYVFLVSLEDSGPVEARVFDYRTDALEYVEELFKYMNMKPSEMDGELMECERVLTQTDDTFNAQGVLARRAKVT